MVTLVSELWHRGILFDSVTQNTVSLIWHEKCWISLLNPQRCFPHIINLACKAVLGEITATSFDNVDADLIARIQALVCAVSLSNYSEGSAEAYHLIFRYGRPHSDNSILQKLSRLCIKETCNFFMMLTHGGHPPYWWLSEHWNLNRFVLLLHQCLLINENI